MKTGFVEVTIQGDSSDSLAAPVRKGSFHVDLIASFVDVQEQFGQTGIRTKMTLREPDDCPNTDGEAGEVLRAVRTLHIKESYEQVKSLILAAKE